MRESGSKDHDFFWLGCVPCRTVKVLGILVGVQVCERRVIYTLDDGTATVDCVHRHESQPPPPPSPAKVRNTPKGKGKEREKADPYKRPSTPELNVKHRTDTQGQTLPLVPVLPTSLADVGAAVSITGRVYIRHGVRHLYVDEIGLCTSANDEPAHWLSVLALHKEKYSQPGPFVIPFQPPAAKAAPAPSETQEALAPSDTDDPILVPTTPKRRPHSPSPAPTSSPVASSSPTKCERTDTEEEQVRLRHPARLHSRDLNLNTFRIYVKHYMDNAPPPAGCRRCGGGYCPHVGGAGCEEDVFRTPRKGRAERDADINETPHATGRGRSGTQGERESVYGFTLSYLRRVPELRLLARRVVEAEAKRRRRAEREALKTQILNRTGTGGRGGSGASGREPVGKKMKRLFEVTVVKLYEEGSIVLWEGPVRRPWWQGQSQSGSEGLWKMGSSSTMLASSVCSVATSVGGEDDDGDEGDLSDPPAEEEAYVPVTPRLLAGYVEDAIRVLTSRSAEELRLAHCRHKRAPAHVDGVGPTKEEIARFLRRGDGRWERVGEWVVEEALEGLRAEGRVWCAGRGRWELCL